MPNNTNNTTVEVNKNEVIRSFVEYMSAKDEGYNNDYALHFNTYKAAIKFQKKQDKETINKLIEALKKYVDEDNGDRTENGFYSKIKNNRYKNACKLIESIEKENI